MSTMTYWLYFIFHRERRSFCSMQSYNKKTMSDQLVIVPFNCRCPFSVWCLGHEVEFDFIGTWSLPLYLPFLDIYPVYGMSTVRRDFENEKSRLMTKPTKWHVRPAKTQISLDIRQSLRWAHSHFIGFVIRRFINLGHIKLTNNAEIDFEPLDILQPSHCMTVCACC